MEGCWGFEASVHDQIHALEGPQCPVGEGQVMFAGLVVGQVRGDLAWTRSMSLEREKGGLKDTCEVDWQDWMTGCI